MAAWIAALLALPALPLVIAGFVLVFTSPSGSAREVRGGGLLAIGLAMTCISNLLLGDWPLAAVTGVGAAVSALLWWRRRTAGGAR